MNPENTLELKGDLNTYPFAELLVEMAQAKLSGSLRLSNGEKKTIVYVRDGEVVFAVSNVRLFRLFSVMLGQHKIDKAVVAQFPNFANDVEFAAALMDKGLFTSFQIESHIILQIKQIIIDSLSWPDGEWVFSPLARLKENMIYDADIYNVLVEYARCLPADLISKRFKSVNETFSLNPENTASVSLHKHESHILNRFNGRPMDLAELRSVAGLPENALLQAIYILWLSGFLQRQDWNTAFSASKLDQIRNASISLVGNRPAAVNIPAAVEKAVPAPVEQTDDPAVKEISLDEYLARIEKAENSYDVLGVGDKAAISEIKAAYFQMAKLFHPDRFHREGAAVLSRVQTAFTGLARAYETLKTPDARKSYDFKIQKELELREKRRAEGIADAPAGEDGAKTENGLENFEIGLNHLMEEEYGEAATHLARAVHYSPENALYHAYYGHVLSFSDKFRHKAEGEMQTAVRLDPKNPKIRMMLAEFFIDMDMLRRAEGELKRFLEIVPNNREARELLNSLQT